MNTHYSYKKKRKTNTKNYLSAAFSPPLLIYPALQKIPPELSNHLETKQKHAAQQKCNPMLFPPAEFRVLNFIDYSSQ